MTITAADQALPPSVRALDRAQLLRLERGEAVAQLTLALGELYLLASGQDDEVDPAELDHSAPLFLESLVAARLNVAFDGWLGVTVPLGTLMQQAPSLAGLSEQLVDALRAGSTSPALPQLVPDPSLRHLEFPLAEIQEAYWIGRDPVFELGNVTAFLYLELRVIDFDVARAEQALQRLIARHDMLRSVVLRDGRQRVLPEVPAYRIEVVDLAGAAGGAGPAAGLAAERDRMLRVEMRADQWRPFEIRLVRLPDRRAQLLINFNMVKLDAWSAQLLLTEWFSLYDDPGQELPELGLTFRDYALWAREVEASDAVERSRQYWLDRVPALPPAPELPLARPLDSVPRPRFTSHSARLDREHWSALKAHAERNGLTPSMALCAAYAEVLATWSRRQRFTLNVSGGRPAVHPEMGRIVGPFARPTLLEVDATRPGDFTARAQAIARQFAADFEHRDFGGLQVLRELARTRGLTKAATPVIFTSALPQGGEGALAEPAWLDADRYMVWGMPQLLLENQVMELDGALVSTWVAVDELFEPGVLEEMFDAYQQLVRRLADDETAWSAAELPLLPDAQLARRAAVNQTAAPVPAGLLHSGFTEQAARRGEAPAVISARRTVSYAELDRHANWVATELGRRGARPNTLVAVCMEKGWEQVAAVLGVLRAGAAYLPLDPELPARRQHYLLANGEVSLVLTQPWVDERLSWPEGVERLLVDEHCAADRVPDAANDPTDLAYVMFTSGSTGLPKGVMIDHRGALNTIVDVNRRFNVGPPDRVLALSALSFDLSVYDIFGVLAAGGAIVLPEPAGAKDPAHWAELIERERVTLWNSVPALMEMLVEHGPAASSGLRLALLSGDWIPTGLPERIERAFQGIEVISLGGATEASIWSIFHPIKGSQRGRRSVPYGRPLDNQRWHVLNERMAPCPDLVAGELYIAGVGLAKGYWRDQEKTAASFFAHPKSGETPGETRYWTGDFGRYLRDGSIEFLGRADSQVKVNGYRIELGEIEAALAEHPAVRSAAAVVHGDRAETKWLAAFVAAAADLPPGSLRAFLAERLPEYAIPARIVRLDELPLTTNGKVDRAALPRLDGVAAGDRQEPSPPRTALETKLTKLWAEVLDRPDVGVDDNIFELGATSLRAVQFATRAQDAGLWLTAADVLRNQTVRALAAVADGRTGLPATDGTAPCAATS